MPCAIAKDPFNCLYVPLCLVAVCLYIGPLVVQVQSLVWNSIKCLVVSQTGTYGCILQSQHGASVYGPCGFQICFETWAAGIDSVCFLRRNSIDLLHRETCSWVASFQQAIPLSSAAFSKSPGHSASIWLSLQLTGY